MKKKYVNLNIEVVEVQLSDCIAGSSSPVVIKEGLSENNEVDCTAGGNGGITFTTW